jgi:hypothetical protein
MSRNLLKREASETASSGGSISGLTSAPQWVQDGQAHFSQHGFYRATDVARALGEPGKGVEGHASADLCTTRLFRK